ncbi:unnamed protein product, partial [Rotaria magnacalcarata]
ETSIIQTLQFHHPIIRVQFNQSIDPRPEYIRVIIIEWSIKSSIPIARTVSLDTQRQRRSQGRGKWAIARFIWRFAHCNFY